MSEASLLNSSSLMSTPHPTIGASKLTVREARYVVLRLQGQSRRQALKALGFNENVIHHPGRTIETPEVIATIERLQSELVNDALEQGLIDAREIHEYLTDALRARISDIQRDDGSFLPISEWPDIWQRMYEGGDIEVETKSERSHDGERKDKDGGWDEAGTVTKVKFRFASRQRLLELAMKHKAVNAMVQATNTNIDVNIAVVTAEQARELSAAQKRLARVVEAKVIPETTTTTDSGQ